MSTARFLPSLCAVLVLTGTVRAQSVDLSETPLTGSFFKVSLTMDLKGKTRVQQEDKVLEQPLTARAEHEYVEKVLEEKKLDGGGPIIAKTARIYRTAHAVIGLDGKSVEKGFKTVRTLVVTQRREHGGTLSYCPELNRLTRDELDLTEHFNTLALTALLPGKQVQVGTTWPVDRDAVQTLCSLDGLEKHDLTCKLDEVKGNLARVSLTGSVKGIELGREVSILVTAHYQFDLDTRRLTSLTWKQTDERGQGPASPGIAADVTFTVQRSAIEQPTELNATYLAGAIPGGKEPPPEKTLLVCTDPGKRFEVQHTRDWIMTAQGKEHTVWRMMHRGAHVAQVTVTPLRNRGPGNMLSYKDFVDDVALPHWKVDKVIHEDETLNLRTEGFKAHRYAAEGSLDGQEVVQYFYLVMSPRGDHLAVTFTMNPGQVKDVIPAARDLDFVQAVSFPGSQADSAEEQSAPRRNSNSKN